MDVEITVVLCVYACIIVNRFNQALCIASMIGSIVLYMRAL